MSIRHLTLILIVSFAFAVAGCRDSRGSVESSLEPANRLDPADTEYLAPDAKGVATMTVDKTVIPEYLDLTAHIETDPTQVVHVFAPAGGRIIQMKVRPWERVEKGQMIAVLESGDLARAVAEYRKAQADNQVKQKQLSRLQDLLEHHAVSEKDFQQAQGDAQVAQAEVESSREQVQVFGMDPDHSSTQLTITAPRSGVVLDVGAAPGEFAQALSASAPMCTIADITTVWAIGDIYEKDLSAARSGAKADVTVSAYPNQHWKGRVSVVSAAVDPTTRTLHVRVLLPNADGRIKPAMFGQIRLLRSSTQGILLPAMAVVREGNQSYVNVGVGEGRFQRRSVKLGRAIDGRLEILSGVNVGDKIISEGALFLRPAGQR